MRHRRSGFQTTWTRQPAGVTQSDATRRRQVARAAVAQAAATAAAAPGLPGVSDAAYVIHIGDFGG